MGCLKLAETVEFGHLEMVHRLPVGCFVFLESLGIVSGLWDPLGLAQTHPRAQKCSRSRYFGAGRLCTGSRMF